MKQRDAYWLVIGALSAVLALGGRPVWADDEALIFAEIPTVSLAARHEMPIAETPAAVTLITQEDIRRSGLTSLPELLRMVPGLNVAQIDANKWAVSSRGFNGRFADKMLVLIDGRTVFTPMFSGVFWDAQDTLLEDVEQIEVIRGPGASLWGANAVNGVINVVTKKARDTQGALVTGGAGTEERGFGAARYGGRLGEHAHFRVYGKYFNRDDFVAPGGGDAADEWDQGRSGFRLDWEATEENQLTWQGDIYKGWSGRTVTTALLTPPFSRTFNDETKVAGGHTLGRWTHTFDDQSVATLQLYYSRTELEDSSVTELRDTVDLDLQHRFAWGERQQVTWGGGFRWTADEMGNSFGLSFDPRQREAHLSNLFLQDEIALIPDRLRLTLGSKLEHNDFTGFEVQPSGRLLWTVTDQHHVWAAISRAVRTPNRANDDMRVNFAAFAAGPSTALLALLPNRDLESEEVMAYELGYRTQPTSWLTFDVAAFYNDYDKLVTAEPATPFFEPTPPPPHLVMPVQFDNRMDGETYGVETAVGWRVRDGWQLRGGYSYLQMELHRDRSSGDTTAEDAEGESPAHQFHIRSQLDLPWDLEFDTALYYVSHLATGDVPSYVRLDARLGWRPTDALEISVAAQNLLDDLHPEFTSASGVNYAEIERSYYIKVTHRF